MGITSALALICGPSLGMTLFGYSPFTLWISCGCLGLLAALIILCGSENKLKSPDPVRSSIPDFLIS